MTELIIYHNPRCSKSRQVLSLLEERGLEPKIRLYLQDVPTAVELKDLLAKLNLPARKLLRSTEVEFKDRGLADSELTDAELIQAMIEVPKLIQRPILINADKACIGRPPEAVLAII